MWCDVMWWDGMGRHVMSRHVTLLLNHWFFVISGDQQLLPYSYSLGFLFYNRFSDQILMIWPQYYIPVYLFDSYTPRNEKVNYFNLFFNHRVYRESMKRNSSVYKVIRRYIEKWHEIYL